MKTLPLKSGWQTKLWCDVNCSRLVVYHSLLGTNQKEKFQLPRRSSESWLFALTGVREFWCLSSSMKLGPGLGPDMGNGALICKTRGLMGLKLSQVKVIFSQRLFFWSNGHQPLHYATKGSWMTVMISYNSWVHSSHLCLTQILEIAPKRHPQQT